MVAVPELPEDPAWYSRAIADAGYFEAVEITKEDLRRGEMYRANVEREALKVGATNLEGYLASLEMKLEYKPFDKTNLQRIVQLINKTNQFNLTTKRYTQDEVEGLIAAPDAVTLQLRLLDRFGDNGIIAIIIARYVRFTKRGARHLAHELSRIGAAGGAGIIACFSARGAPKTPYPSSRCLSADKKERDSPRPL